MVLNIFLKPIPLLTKKPRPVLLQIDDFCNVWVKMGISVPLWLKRCQDITKGALNYGRVFEF